MLLVVCKPKVSMMSLIMSAAAPNCPPAKQKVDIVSSIPVVVIGWNLSRMKISYCKP